MIVSTFQAIIQLWKDQLLHFGALMFNLVLTHSRQCATEMEIGCLFLSVSVPV